MYMYVLVCFYRLCAFSITAAFTFMRWCCIASHTAKQLPAWLLTLLYEVKVVLIDCETEPDIFGLLEWTSVSCSLLVDDNIQELDVSNFPCDCAVVPRGKRMAPLIPSVVEEHESDDDDDQYAGQYTSRRCILVCVQIFVTDVISTVISPNVRTLCFIILCKCCCGLMQIMSWQCIDLPCMLLFWATICKTVRPMLSNHFPVCLSCPVGLWRWCIVAKWWMHQNETWHGDTTRPRRHCVRWGPSYPLKGAQPPNFQPMSVVAKRLDGSRCHLVAR